MRVSIASPSWAGPASARASALVVPVRREGANPPRTASTATAAATAAQRARTTPRAQAVQARPEAVSLRSRRLGQSSRCPTHTAQRTVALAFATALTVGHSLVTARAAPTNLSQRHVAAGDERALTLLFDRLERLQTIRAALQTATLAAAVWALVASITASSP
jgi:hypothetical protein